MGKSFLAIAAMRALDSRMALKGQPNIDSAVLGTGTAAILRAGEKTIMAAGG
jgi:hypothetical protein